MFVQQGKAPPSRSSSSRADSQPYSLVQQGRAQRHFSPCVGGRIVKTVSCLIVSSSGGGQGVLAN